MKKLLKPTRSGKSLGGTFGNMIKTASKWGLALGAAAVTAATAIGGMAINTAQDVDKAVDSYIVATGTAVEETDRFQNVLTNIYKNNYGEDFQDIADSMSEVKKQLGDIDDVELQNVTESAFALRDTFDYDVTESVRAAKMMMDQWGISSEEAFNLIAQGAQQGLDKNGDLLDSINEYSVHFSQIGLSATDMFNLFKQGADGGAFSIDKCGDAIKEMGIRMKDGSATDALKSMKLDAKSLEQAFAEGGEKGSWAFGQVVDGLRNIQDPLERNNAGVAIFGTMWEDLGEDAVFAMTQYGEAFDETLGTMNEIKQVKYDNLSDMFEGLKRNVEMLLLPLGNSLMPILQQVIQLIMDNMPLIESMVGQIAPIITDLFAQLLPPLTELIQSIFPVMMDLIQQLVPFMVQIIQEILPFLVDIIQQLLPFIMEIAQQFLPVIMNLIEMLLPPIMQIVEMVLPLLIQLIQPLLTLLQPILELLQPFIDLLMNLLTPLISLIQMILPPIIQLLTTIIQAILPPLKAGFELIANVVSTVFNAAFQLISNIISSTINTFQNIINFIRNIFVSSWSSSFSVVQSIFSNVFGAIGTVINTVKTVFQNIIDFVKNVFTGNWKGAWENVKNIFSSIVEGLGNIFKKPINFIIDGINKFIGGLNSLKIPDWVPGVGGLSLNIPTIPRLKVGMDYVPDDDFPALLHKGEAVLTKEENADYRQSRSRQTKGNILDRESNLELYIQKLIDILLHYFPQFADLMDRDIVLDDGTIVGRWTPVIDTNLAGEENKRRRGN